MPHDDDTALFFLPGLVHQFGNLLLTVQGNVLHVEPDDIPRVQRTVLRAVERGSAALQVVRALLGERCGASGDARALLSQLVEFGRVAARDRGVVLELASDGPAAVAAVPAEPFVQVCAAALRHWLEALPAGASGRVPVALRVADDGLRVHVGFQAEAGSLPFPLAVDDVTARLEATAPLAAAGAATAAADGGLALDFVPAGGSPARQP